MAKTSSDESRRLARRHAAGRQRAATGKSARPGADLTRLRLAIDVLALGGEPTGVGRFCAGLTGALLGRQDLEVVGYAVSRHARRTTSRAASGIGLPVRTWPLPTRAVNALWARADLAPIEWLAGRVDVVHGTNYVVPPARRAGRVVTVHDLTALRYPQMCVPSSLAYPRLVARAAGAGALVHVPSRFVRDEVVELLGIAHERVRVVAHGADDPAGGSAQRSPAGKVPGRKAPYLLALGSVEPRKDLPTLVRAFAEIAGEHEDLELVIAGPQGWGEAELAAAVSACGLGSRVVRVGYLQEAQRQSLLSGAVALAYPSVYEGFGFPPLEAMGRACRSWPRAPVPSPRSSATRPSSCPPATRPHSPRALSAVLRDESLRSRLIAAGHARAALFTWASCAENMTGGVSRGGVGGDGAVTTISVSLAAEQLRRRVPGGIGTYTRGLLKGLGELDTSETAHVSTLVASRPAVAPTPSRTTVMSSRALVCPGRS